MNFRIALFFAAVALSACVAPPQKPLPPAPAVHTAVAPKRQSYWEGDGVAGAAKIVVHLGEQRAYFYKADKLVGEAPISSGRTGFATPPGSYRVMQKDAKHVSNLYGEFVNAEGEVVKSNVDVTKDKPPEGATFRGASMPYFLRFQSGYGLHAGRLPGHRASHGCIRMPREMARHFFEHVEIGTPVSVEDETAAPAPTPASMKKPGSMFSFFHREKPAPDVRR